MASEIPRDFKRPAPHWEMLAICLAVIVLSLLLEVRSDDRVAFFALPSARCPRLVAVGHSSASLVPAVV